MMRNPLKRSPVDPNLTSIPTAPPVGAQYLDVSAETPAGQYAALVQILEENDAVSPAPNTLTPPLEEYTDANDYVSQLAIDGEYMVAPDMQVSDLPSVIEDAYGSDIPEWDWENDPQYYGLGVPPGVPNYGQPIESGHTQITPPNPSDELGWDAWAGKPVLARVARHENMFTRYGALTSGSNHGPRVEGWAGRGPMNPFTQQTRDLMLAELKQRGIHNQVVSYIQPPAYSDQVIQIDPTVYASQEIGPEGVLP